MKRAEFPTTVKLAAWQRAGGPDNPLCECYLEAGKPNSTYEDCGRQPITKSDPAQYHHLYEAEGATTPERRKWLRSIENCACIRASCHKLITAKVTMPSIVKSRGQRAGNANAKTPKRKMGYRRFDGTIVWPSR